VGVRRPRTVAEEVAAASDGEECDEYVDVEVAPADVEVAPADVEEAAGEGATHGRVGTLATGNGITDTCTAAGTLFIVSWLVFSRDGCIVICDRECRVCLGCSGCGSFRLHWFFCVQENLPGKLGEFGVCLSVGHHAPTPRWDHTQPGVLNS
jgi:hypothetical protein